MFNVSYLPTANTIIISAHSSTSIQHNIDNEYSNMIAFVTKYGTLTTCNIIDIRILPSSETDMRAYIDRIPMSFRDFTNTYGTEACKTEFNKYINQQIVGYRNQLLPEPVFKISIDYIEKCINIIVSHNKLIADNVDKILATLREYYEQSIIAPRRLHVIVGQHKYTLIEFIMDFLPERKQDFHKVFADSIGNLMADIINS